MCITSALRMSMLHYIKTRYVCLPTYVIKAVMMIGQGVGSDRTTYLAQANSPFLLSNFQVIGFHTSKVEYSDCIFSGTTGKYAVFAN